MSRKKFYTSIGLPFELMERLKQDAYADERTIVFIVEKILREHYKMPRGVVANGAEEKHNADQ